MAENQDGPKDARVPTGSDLVIPIAAIILAVYYFTTIIGSPWTAKVTGYMVGLPLCALSATFIVKSLLRLKSGQAWFTVRDLIEPVSMLPQRAALFALVLASLIFIPWLGFTLTSILFLSSSMLLMTNGRNSVTIITLSVILSIAWFIIFVLIFKRRFPLGWLDDQLTALILPALKAIGLG